MAAYREFLTVDEFVIFGFEESASDIEVNTNVTTGEKRLI